jgi:hypothetical protein
MRQTAHAQKKVPRQRATTELWERELAPADPAAANKCTQNLGCTSQLVRPTKKQVLAAPLRRPPATMLPLRAAPPKARLAPGGWTSGPGPLQGWASAAQTSSLSLPSAAAGRRRTAAAAATSAAEVLAAGVVDARPRSTGSCATRQVPSLPCRGSRPTAELTKRAPWASLSPISLSSWCPRCASSSSMVLRGAWVSLCLGSPPSPDWELCHTMGAEPSPPWEPSHSRADEEGPPGRVALASPKSLEVAAATCVLVVVSVGARPCPAGSCATRQVPSRPCRGSRPTAEPTKRACWASLSSPLSLSSSICP